MFAHMRSFMQATVASLEGAAASLVQEQTPTAAQGAADDQDVVLATQVLQRCNNSHNPQYS